MATFRTYAEALRPDHPMAKIHKAALSWRPSRYRPAEMDRDMRAEPGAVLADVLQQTGGAYETMVRLMPKFREIIREIAEVTSDDGLHGVAELDEVPVSLEHLRHADPRTRILVGYQLDVTPETTAYSKAPAVSRTKTACCQAARWPTAASPAPGCRHSAACPAAPPPPTRSSPSTR